MLTTKELLRHDQRNIKKERDKDGAESTTSDGGGGYKSTEGASGSGSAQPPAKKSRYSSYSYNCSCRRRHHICNGL